MNGHTFVEWFLIANPDIQYTMDLTNLTFRSLNFISHFFKFQHNNMVIRKQWTIFN